jgi:hypothetical protein
MVSVPFRGRAADTHHTQSVPDQIGNFFQTLMPFHGPTYIKGAKAASTAFSRLWFAVAVVSPVIWTTSSHKLADPR